MVDEISIAKISEKIVREFQPERIIPFLTRAAVDFRYPGESADQKEAAQSFESASRLRARLLQFLG